MTKKPRDKDKGIPHTFIGLVFDGLDMIGIGLIPGIGDVIDLIGTAYFLRALGPEGVTAAIEVFPAWDILPINIALGIYADYKKKPKVIKF